MPGINKILVKTFELKEKEVKIFKLLFLHSFALGWFIAFYFASANSVFIVHYGSQDLPYAYIIAGLAGYILSSFYSFIQKRVSTKILFSFAILFMLIITLAGRLGLNFVDEKLLSAFMFIWAWPFISLSSIELGGLAIRFLNLIQVKRLYGLFNMGGVIAAILSYFAIPLLKPFIGNVYNYFYVGSLGLIVGLYLLFRLYKQSDIEEKKVEKKQQTKQKIGQLLKNKYIFWIFLSATLSMTMIYLTDFGFLSSVKVNIAPDDIPQYLAIVFGALKVGELLISYFSRRLLTSYGVKLGLTILPITSSLLVLAAGLWGVSFGTGLVFLIMMTSLKSLERILRRGLDDPAFNILYQPLKDDQKIAIQSRVGIVMQFSIALAGLLLLLANKILVHNGQFNLKLYPWYFLPILIIWVFVAVNLYRSYKAKIREILAEISKDKRRGTDKYQYGTEILRKHLNDSDFFAVSFSATILSDINPKAIEAYASNLLKKYKNPYFLKVILRSIDPTWRRRLAKIIDRIDFSEMPPDVRKIADHAKENLNYSEVKSIIPPDEVRRLLNSDDVHDRLLLIKYINKLIYTPDDDTFIKLLRDKEKIVKISAINISAHFKSEKIMTEIAGFLNTKEYRHIAANTLLDMGGRVLHVLENLYKETSDKDVLLKIIEIYSKIGTKEAQKLLLKHMNYPDRDVQIAVIFGLFYCKFRSNEEQRNLIIQKLWEIIDNILWIYATMLDIEGQANTLKLFLALDFQKEFYFDLIFLVLSFLYEPRIITLIQKNIVGKDTIFALEIMDNFFDSDIKKLVTPIFDDITPTQKLKRLNNLFPQKRMKLTERLKDIILQDYSRVDSWTVAKAIELLGRLHRKKVTSNKKNNEYLDYSDIKIWRKDRIFMTLEKIRRLEIPDEIFVALYHTDELIYTTAAKLIFEENPVKCFDYLANMSVEKQLLMQKLSNEEILIDEKIKYIKRFYLFFNVPESLIPNIAKYAEILNLKAGSSLQIVRNKKEYIYLILKGLLSYSVSETEEKIFAKNDIIVRGINFDIFAQKVNIVKDSLIIAFPRIDFFNILISNKDIIRYILSDTSDLAWIIN